MAQAQYIVFDEHYKSEVFLLKSYLKSSLGNCPSRKKGRFCGAGNVK